MLVYRKFNIGPLATNKTMNVRLFFITPSSFVRQCFETRCAALIRRASFRGRQGRQLKSSGPLNTCKFLTALRGGEATRPPPQPSTRVVRTQRHATIAKKKGNTKKPARDTPMERRVAQTKTSCEFTPSFKRDTPIQSMSSHEGRFDTLPKESSDDYYFILGEKWVEPECLEREKTL